MICFCRFLLDCMVHIDHVLFAKCARHEAAGADPGEAILFFFFGGGGAHGPTPNLAS